MWSFRVLAGLLTLVLIGIGSKEFLDAWILRDPSQSIHLWHVAEMAALTIIVLAGSLLTLLQRPQEKPLLAQFFALSVTVLAMGMAPFEPWALGLLPIVTLFCTLYPYPCKLPVGSREGPLSYTLLALTAICGAFLLPLAWREMQWQSIGMLQHDIHAHLFHWAGSALLMVVLVLGGLLAATKWQGWLELGFIIGAAYCYLGVMAMLSINYAGSWGGAGGLFAIFAGTWYIIFSALETKRVYKPSPASTQAQKVTQAIFQDQATDNAPEERALALPTARTQPLGNTRELVGV